MSRSQIYGGREQDEYRNRRDTVNDILMDNEIAEGKEVAELRSLLKKSFEEPQNQAAKQAIVNYMTKLKQDGHSDSRIVSMYSRASSRLSITPKKIVPQVSARALRRQQRKNIT